MTHSYDREHLHGGGDPAKVTMATVIGISIDREEISRVERVFSSPRALARVFTAHETAYCQPKCHRASHVAGPLLS